MIVRQAELSIDVHCLYAGQGPRYRVYVDQDLLTERTFIWPSGKQYIQEHLVVHLQPGQHTVRIENVDPDLGIITTKNLTLDGVPTAGENVFEII
jgi:hypothetical protein